MLFIFLFVAIRPRAGCQLKDHCHDKAHVRFWLTPIRLEFQVLFENIYKPAFEFLFAKIIYHVYVVWRPCPSYFLPTCIYICSYVKFLIFVLLSSIQVDQVAFVSSRFENLLSRTSYFSTVFSSKHKICRWNLLWSTKQLFNIGITIFTRLMRSMEKDFSHIYHLWKMFRYNRLQPNGLPRQGKTRLVFAISFQLCSATWRQI